MGILDEFEDVYPFKPGINASDRNRRKIHCVRGHLLAGANVMLRKRDGARLCRACVRINNKIQRDKAKSKNDRTTKASLELPDGQTRQLDR